MYRPQHILYTKLCIDLNTYYIDSKTIIYQNKHFTSQQYLYINTYFTLQTERENVSGYLKLR